MRNQLEKTLKHLEESVEQVYDNVLVHQTKLNGGIDNQDEYDVCTNEINKSTDTLRVMVKAIHTIETLLLK